MGGGRDKEKKREKRDKKGWDEDLVVEGYESREIVA